MHVFLVTGMMLTGFVSKNGLDPRLYSFTVGPPSSLTVETLNAAQVKDNKNVFI